MTQISLDYLPPPAAEARPARRGAYPRHYAWVLALAILDIIVTTLVLSTGGRELNAIARWAIEHAGVLGMVAIKATTLTIVLLICEYLARHRPRAGLKIAELALIANSAAVACGLIYLAQFSFIVLHWTYMQ
jgi:hypothetical protein